MPRAGVTAERLTRAAAELADRDGLDAVTVSALARRFGVTVASLYSHVRGIEDLRTRMAALALRELADQAAADNLITGALNKLFALQEAYPDLKANQNFLALQEELTAKIGRAHV